MPGFQSSWLPTLCLAALVCLASGQEVNGPTGAINSPTLTVQEGEITVHTIEVSNRTHYFTPNNIQALPGDIITFKFWPGNHSVIRAEYAYPCIPYEDLEGNGEGGFYSGVMSPDSQDVRNDNLPTWNLTINSTAPTFFYCGAPGSCVNWAMLGAINADANHSVETQINLAREAAYVLTPGQTLPADVKTSMDNLAHTATVTVTNSEATSTSTTTSAAAAESTSDDSSETSGSTKSGLGTGAIVGIVVGGVALLALAGGLFYFFGRSKTLSEQLRHSRTPNTGAPPNPDNAQGYGGSNSRHTSFLPPYAQVVPHYPNEAKPPSLQEADGGAFASYGHVPQHAVSPEMRQADTFGGFSYPDSRPSIQNMNMGYSRHSDVSRQASPPPPPPPQPVHEMSSDTTTTPREGRGPFREMF